MLFNAWKCSFCFAGCCFELVVNVFWMFMKHLDIVFFSFIKEQVTHDLFTLNYREVCKNRVLHEKYWVKCILCHVKLGVSKKTKKLIKSRKPEKKITKKTDLWKKSTSSIWFRFYKPETENTNWTKFKPKKNRVKPEKIESNRFEHYFSPK